MKKNRKKTRKAKIRETPGVGKTEKPESKKGPEISCESMEQLEFPASRLRW